MGPFVGRAHPVGTTWPTNGRMTEQCVPLGGLGRAHQLGAREDVAEKVEAEHGAGAVGVEIERRNIQSGDRKEVAVFTVSGRRCGTDVTCETYLVGKCERTGWK